MTDTDNVPTATFKKFPNYVPKDDDAYLDFTMKALDWQEDTKQKLEERLRMLNPDANGENLYEAGYREGRRKLIKELLESLK